MGFLGYELLVSLSQEQIAARRASLDKHAAIAQCSQFVVLIILIVFKLTSSLVTRWTVEDHESAPSSPQKKYLAEGREKSFIHNIASRWRILNWQLGNEVATGYGTYKQWLGGLVWTAWLAVLCFQGTAPDYMHFTKRFGLVAASQLPLHYLLAMKSPYSPLQMMLRTSHENLNAAHQVLGRIVALFMLLHASCYVNFFLLTGFWVKRFKDVDVLLGLASATLVVLIGSTAMGYVRRRNYRLFFTIHATAPILLLVLLYFHVQYIRVYVLEALAIALLNMATRVLSFKHVPAQLEWDTKTNLLQISAPRQKFDRRWAPGSHIYLREASGWRSYFRANPFTIATLANQEADRVTLVARVLRGTTRRFANYLQPQESLEPQSMQETLVFEGPYGDARYLPNLTRFERIIFVAGGVGATYIMPLLQNALDMRAANSIDYQDFKLVWSVKQVEDASWAIKSLSKPRANRLNADERDLYITGHGAASAETGDAVELSARSNGKSESTLESLGFIRNQGRPDFRQILDQCLSGNTGQVAVFACGPARMTSDLRRHVGRWIGKGRDIYWHAEEFGL